MKDWIDAKVASTKLDYFDFFRSAYFWYFQKLLTSKTDVLRYKADGIIPIYLAAYVRFLQQLEGQRGKQ